MKLWSLPLLAAGLSLSLQAADPELINLVMPDAKLVAGIKVSQAQASPFGQFLLSQININSQRDKIVQSTGFDPLRDLNEIVVASNGNNGGILIGKGVFQPGRVSAALSMLGGQSTTYKGLQLIGGNATNNGAIAFLDASTLAAGTSADLKALIDRRVSAGPYSGALAQGIRDTSGNYDAWFVADSPSALANGRIPQGTQVPARVMQTVKQVSGGVRLGGNSISVVADALTASSQDAQALADALRFLAAMAENDPKAAALLQNVQFAANGSTMRMSFDLPEKDAESLFLSRPTPKPMRRGIQ